MRNLHINIIQLHNGGHFQEMELINLIQYSYSKDDLGKDSAHSLLRSAMRQTSFSEYVSFTWKMLLKKAIFGDIGEDSGLGIHCSGLLLDKTLNSNCAGHVRTDLFIVSTLGRFGGHERSDI